MFPLLSIRLPQVGHSQVVSEFFWSEFTIFLKLQTLHRIDIILLVSNMIYLLFWNVFSHGRVSRQNYGRFPPNENCNVRIGISFYFTFSSGFFFSDFLDLSASSATLVLHEPNLIFSIIFSNMILNGAFFDIYRCNF